MNLPIRPRRLRSTASIRDMVSEIHLSRRNLIQPYFLTESSKPEPIAKLANFSRLNTEHLLKEIEIDLERGLSHFLLFGTLEDNEKDDTGSKAISNEHMLPKAIFEIKKRFGDNTVLYSDVCFCPYTSHAHCGPLKSENNVDNDETVSLLAKLATVHAQAGVDFVGPSDMMDGRIGFIRKILDQQGYSDTGILAYSAKYVSQYYGSFRDAVKMASSQVTRSTYQMDYRNRREALREVNLDLQEGADIVMVKPALAYLDILSDVAQVSSVPVYAYSVGGEYQMMKLMAREGLVVEEKFVLENLYAIKRAGAHGIITYYAKEIAEKGWLK